jgi:hypothetical protein
MAHLVPQFLPLFEPCVIYQVNPSSAYHNYYEAKYGEIETVRGNKRQREDYYSYDFDCNSNHFHKICPIQSLSRHMR